VSFRTATLADLARRFTRADDVTDFGGDPAFFERAGFGVSRAIALPPVGDVSNDDTCSSVPRPCGFRPVAHVPEPACGVLEGHRDVGAPAVSPADREEQPKALLLVTAPWHPPCTPVAASEEGDMIQAIRDQYVIVAAVIVALGLVVMLWRTRRGRGHGGEA
jgi:hypothetical protein